MRRWLLTATVGTALLFSSSPSSAVLAEEDEGTCVTCHEVDIDEILAKPVPEWRESVHAVHWVSCDACHGGDPRIEDADESMSEEAGFMDLPSWSEMSDHCGMCHEALAESWRRGRFGQALEQGQRVPTCATCHMQDGHRIVEARPAEVVTGALCEDCPSLVDPPATIALLEGLAQREATLREEMATVESLGASLSDLREELRGVHEAFQLALHRFEGDAIEVGRMDAANGYARLTRRVSDFEAKALSHRRFGLGMLAALALLFAALWMGSRARPRALEPRELESRELENGE